MIRRGSDKGEILVAWRHLVKRVMHGGDKYHDIARHGPRMAAWFPGPRRSWKLCSDWAARPDRAVPRKGQGQASGKDPVGDSVW